jgi:hypothetical protein
VDTCRRLIDVELPGDLIRGRLEFLDPLSQTAGDFRNALGSKDEQDGQENEYEFKRSQASHMSAGWNRSEVRVMCGQQRYDVAGGSYATSTRILRGFVRAIEWRSLF